MHIDICAYMDDQVAEVLKPYAITGRDLLLPPVVKNCPNIEDDKC
jgi:hypothetical protein